MSCDVLPFPAQSCSAPRLSLDNLSVAMQCNILSASNLWAIRALPGTVNLHPIYLHRASVCRLFPQPAPCQSVEPIRALLNMSSSPILSMQLLLSSCSAPLLVRS